MERRKASPNLKKHERINKMKVSVDYYTASTFASEWVSKNYKSFLKTDYTDEYNDEFTYFDDTAAEERFEIDFEEFIFIEHEDKCEDGDIEIEYNVNLSKVFSEVVSDYEFDL